MPKHNKSGQNKFMDSDDNGSFLGSDDDDSLEDSNLFSNQSL